MQSLARYLFVDGESFRTCLRRICQRAFQDDAPTIAWNNLRADYRRVYFYDAIPVQMDSENEISYVSRVTPKRSELAFIDRQPGYHVRSGDAVHRRRRGNEQKMVDVQLAVDALLMANRGLFQSVTLITGDLDFRPLISALVEMGIEVQLLYPLGETSDYLLSAADRADPITLPLCLSWLDASYRDRYPIPQSFCNLKNTSFDAATSLVSWSDHRFGLCQIFSIGDEFHLITEYEPNNPATHRLEMKHQNPELVRMYASEVFQIDVPIW